MNLIKKSLHAIIIMLHYVSNSIILIIKFKILYLNVCLLAGWKVNMPLTKSAKKALRTDRTRKETNDLTRHKIKSAIKAARLAISGSEKDAQIKLNAAYKELDIAAKKNVIHKNKASRLKSRLTKKIAKVASTPTEVKPVKKVANKKKIA